MTRNVLSLDQVRSAAPAVFADKPHSRLTDRYQFLPTSQVVEFLISQGVQPVTVQQRKARTEEGGVTAKHLIRFDLSALVPTASTTEVPEIVMLNSHDGLSTYRFALGIFRSVCSNGLVVSSHETGDIHMRHLGNGFKDEIFNTIQVMLDYTKKVYGKIDAMKAKSLTDAEIFLLAQACTKVRWEDTTIVDMKDVTQIRRPEDNSNDLWTVFNRAQENIIKAGFYGRNLSNPQKTRRIREVRNIDATYNYNKKLWEVAESFL